MGRPLLLDNLLLLLLLLWCRLQLLKCCLLPAAGTGLATKHWVLAGDADDAADDGMRKSRRM
jgi:hypothetical protein